MQVRFAREPLQIAADHCVCLRKLGDTLFRRALPAGFAIQQQVDERPSLLPRETVAPCVTGVAEHQLPPDEEQRML